VFNVAGLASALVVSLVSMMGIADSAYAGGCGSVPDCYHDHPGTFLNWDKNSNSFQCMSATCGIWKDVPNFKTDTTTPFDPNCNYRMTVDHGKQSMGNGGVDWDNLNGWFYLGAVSPHELIWIAHTNVSHVPYNHKTQYWLDTGPYSGTGAPLTITKMQIQCPCQ